MSRRRVREQDRGDRDEGALPGGGQRLDKWLWFARVTKTRTLAGELITAGKVRVNGVRAEKSAVSVKLGDTISVLTRERMRVVVVRGFAERRGGADVAAGLFEDKTLPEERLGKAAYVAAADGSREQGTGRPTKKDRRAIDRFKRPGD